MARVYNKKEGKIEFTAGTSKPLELSRNYHVMKYILTLKMNVTTDADEVARVYDNNLFRLINILTLTANGGLHIKDITGEKLYYNYVFDNGFNPLCI
jgi:hypothetical protein